MGKTLRHHEALSNKGMGLEIPEEGQGFQEFSKANLYDEAVEISTAEDQLAEFGFEISNREKARKNKGLNFKMDDRRKSSIDENKHISKQKLKMLKKKNKFSHHIL
jgi:hypothetical protein